MMNVGMFKMLFTVKNEKTSDNLMRVFAIDDLGAGLGHVATWPLQIRMGASSRFPCYYFNTIDQDNFVRKAGRNPILGGYVDEKL